MSTARKRERSDDNLDQAIDFFDEAQHAAQDKEILESVDDLDLAEKLDDIHHKKHVIALGALANTVASRANELLKTNPMRGPKEIEGLLRASEIIQNIVRQAWQERKFRAIRMIPELQAESIHKKPKIAHGILRLGDRATTHSWTGDYLGEAWKILEEKIQDVRRKDEQNNYARAFTLVQSSGTGKSRLIDEYSKKHVVIPLCLREDRESGFPGADPEVREFLREDQSYLGSLRAAHAFLFALFEGVESKFNTFPADIPLPKSIWNFMNSTTERSDFYADVVAKARKIKYSLIIEGEDDEAQAKKGNVFSEQDGDNTPPSAMSSSTQEAKRTPSKKVALPSGQNIVDMAKKLVATVQRLVPQWDQYEAPILLSFDEAHTLTEPLTFTPVWTPHFSIRAVLRTLRREPMFSVFLSTTGKFSEFVPAAEKDPSKRIQDVILHHHDPICGLGYDVMARDFVVENKHKLADYASVEGMSRFGRPLFYTRWKNGDPDVQNNLISFAAAKILGGKEPRSLAAGEVTPSDILAVLCMRIPLEFNATTVDGRLESFNQVHSHMRLSIAVDHVNQTCETVQPAEPLLAEAAFHIIQTQQMNQVYELLRVLGGPTISKGDRGEFTCVLLWLLARDKAVQEGKDRVIKVLDLMDSLLAKTWHDAVRNAYPSELANDEDCVPFDVAFKDAITHFTQFIKVHDAKIIKREFLWVALARGAAILCANNQGGLDIIIPILIRNVNLARSILSAIIIQVKNRASDGANPNRVLFDLMDPYSIGFYDPQEQDTLPIIRMVFALGSEEPIVTVLEGPKRKQPGRAAKEATMAKSGRSKFTSYDIWCAKASTETFAVVEKDAMFADLLKREKSFPRSYKCSIAREEEARRQMHPMALSESAHWHFAFPEKKDGKQKDKQKD